MIIKLPECGDERVRFAWWPTPICDATYEIVGWVWLEKYTQVYQGRYWGWRNIV